MVKLYRDMEEHDDNLPVIGYSSKRLGVRIVGLTVKEGEVFDIVPDSEGYVHPESEGLSVTPPSIKTNIKPFLLKRILKKKTVLWEIDKTSLSLYDLKYRVDPNDETHGFIEPINKMAANNFISLVLQTRPHWRKSDDL